MFNVNETIPWFVLLCFFGELGNWSCLIEMITWSVVANQTSKAMGMHASHLPFWVDEGAFGHCAWLWCTKEKKPLGKLRFLVGWCRDPLDGGAHLLALIPSHDPIKNQLPELKRWGNLFGILQPVWKEYFVRSLYICSYLPLFNLEIPFGFFHSFFFFVVQCNNFATDMELIRQAAGPWCDSPGQ